MGIKCHNSGDGAFHLSNGENQLTLEDAKEFLANSPKLTQLRYEKWRAVLIEDKPVLVANIVRIGDGLLSINEQVFSYEIEEHLRLNEHCPDYALKIWSASQGENKLVVNYSLRSQIRHFLNNEQDLS